MAVEKDPAEKGVLQSILIQKSLPRFWVKLLKNTYPKLISCIKLDACSEKLTLKLLLFKPSFSGFGTP